MSYSDSALQLGDLVFHPRFGFGAVRDVTRRARVQPASEPAPAATPVDATEEYYDIQLDEGGTLWVPVNRAQSVGLRRLSLGVAAIKEKLSSPAQELPANFRERAEALRQRGQRAEPAAFVNAVRDMLAQSRGRTLSAGEKSWLAKSCQRLSTEAARVDQISIYDAEDAIEAVVRKLTAS